MRSCGKKWAIAGVGSWDSMRTGRPFCSPVQHSANSLSQSLWALSDFCNKTTVQRQAFLPHSPSLARYGTYLLSPRACTSSKLWQMSSHLVWQPQCFHMRWQELFSRSTNIVANSKDWLNQLQRKTTKDRCSVYWDTKLVSLTSSSYTPFQIYEGNWATAFISRQLYNKFAARNISHRQRTLKELCKWS